MKKKLDKDKLLKALILAAKTNSGRVHVLKTEHGWAIKLEGNSRITAEFQTKKRAIVNALRVVQSGKSSKMVVHTEDGSVEAG